METEDEPQDSLKVAPFPAPPPFYKHFTPDNLVRLRQIRDGENGSEDHAKPEAADGGLAGDQLSRDAKLLEKLPVDLQYLVPPPPPQSSIYRTLGNEVDISNPLPSLHAQGIPQLYPSPPTSPAAAADCATATASRTHSLITLARSLLLSYLELLSLLSHNPALFPQKIDDLRLLFTNMHHLVNEYRPHQARETLVGMLEDEVRRRKEEVENVRALKTRVDALVRELEGGHGVAAAAPVEGRGGDTRFASAEGEGEEEARRAREVETRARERERERRVWDALDAIEV